MHRGYPTGAPAGGSPQAGLHPLDWVRFDTIRGPPPMPPARNRNPEIAAVVAFVVIQVLAPFLVGEVYPFTISPMFSDAPQRCAIYGVRDPDGRELDPALFGLHLVYDGNPPGFGVGVCPAPTLHPFGEIGDPARLTVQIQETMLANPALPRVVTIVQKTIEGGREQLQQSVREWTVKCPAQK